MSPEDRQNRRRLLAAAGWPRTLEDLFERTGLTLDDCGHLCVDNQMRFMESPAMEGASDKINHAIAPAFNQLGIRTYWIIWPKNDAHIPRYASDLEKRNFMDGAEQLRDVWPADIDRVIPKNCRSAFIQWHYGDAPTLTEQILEMDGPDILFVTGFFADMCLKSTVEDACEKGYLVAWLEDGSNLGEYGAQQRDAIKRELEDIGVVFTTSEDAFASIRKRALYSPAIRL